MTKTFHIHFNPGFQRFKQALGFIPKPGTDLKYVLRRLMFTNDKEPIPVSNDEARFKMVMSVFTNYEKQVISLKLYFVLRYVYDSTYCSHNEPLAINPSVL